MRRPFQLLQQTKLRYQLPLNAPSLSFSVFLSPPSTPTGVNRDERSCVDARF